MARSSGIGCAGRPASTEVAEAATAGHSRGSSTVGIPAGYVLQGVGQRAKSLATKSCTMRGSSIGTVNSRSGAYEVRR